MKMISQIALGAALAFGGVTAATLPATAVQAQEEEYQLDLSKKARKPLAAAQEAYQAQDYQTALAHIAEAEQAAKKPDDIYFANQLKLNIALANDDDAATETALRAMLDSGSPAVTAESQAQYLGALASLATKRDDTAGAMGYYQQLSQLQPNNPDAKYNMGVLQLQSGQEQQSYETFGEAIRLKEATGETADESWYRQRLASALSNQYDVTEPSHQLIRAYPSERNWRDVLLTYRDSGQMSDDENLDVFRLLADRDALEGEGDYYEYANTAYGRRYLGEARSIFEEGVGEGQLDSSKPYVTELKGLIDENYAADQAELDDLAAEARAETDGKLAESTATAYLGYGDNDEAAALYRAALEKGGVDSDEVNMRLGIALSRMGDVAGARQAFEQVSDGRKGQLADLWIAHLESQNSVG